MLGVGPTIEECDGPLHPVAGWPIRAQDRLGDDGGGADNVGGVPDGPGAPNTLRLQGGATLRLSENRQTDNRNIIVRNNGP